MERLVIDIPDEKSSLVKQILKELGVIIQPEKTINKSDLRKKLTEVSVWSDDDLKVIENCKTDIEIFLEALLNPPAPNDALKQARLDYLKFKETLASKNTTPE